MPPEKLKFRQQEFLNMLGIPVEYHNMSLSTQAAPMALRMFESFWQTIPAFYNNILSWIVDTLTRVYSLEPTKVVMQKTTIADDAERKNVLLQLMSANQISPQTALQPFGVDAYDEARKVKSQEKFVAKLQEESDEEEMRKQEMGALSGMVAQPGPAAMMQQQQMAAGGGDPAMGGMPPIGTPMGGAPAGGMPGQGSTPTSLSEMSEQAQAIAQQLVSMDEYSRKQELKALREGNKDLHALVRKYMEDVRSQARSQGGQMLLAQGGGAPQ
jgi:hypothetical protein